MLVEVESVTFVELEEPDVELKVVEVELVELSVEVELADEVDDSVVVELEVFSVLGVVVEVDAEVDVEALELVVGGVELVELEVVSILGVVVEVDAGEVVVGGVELVELELVVLGVTELELEVIVGESEVVFSVFGELEEDDVSSGGLFVVEVGSVVEVDELEDGVVVVVVSVDVNFEVEVDSVDLVVESVTERVREEVIDDVDDVIGVEDVVVDENDKVVVFALQSQLGMVRSSFSVFSEVSNPVYPRLKSIMYRWKASISVFIFRITFATFLDSSELRLYENAI